MVAVQFDQALTWCALRFMCDPPLSLLPVCNLLFKSSRRRKGHLNKTLSLPARGKQQCVLVILSIIKMISAPHNEWTVLKCPALKDTKGRMWFGRKLNT